MFFRLLALFIIVPVLELCLFLWLGQHIGIATTLAIIILTAILGAHLTRTQGLRALQRYREAISAGKLPHEEVLDGLMILIAGAVLLTPGFLTDAIGFSLLIPTVRDLVRAVVKTKLKDRIHVAGIDPRNPAAAETRKRPDVINVEAEVVDDIPRERQREN